MNLTTIAPVSSYTAYKTAVLIWKIFPPILIVLGTIGNVCSIIVLTRKEFRRSSMSLMLITLAFTDLLVLYTGCLRQWLKFIIDFDIRLHGRFWCKINAYIIVFTTHYSSWILVLITAERFCSVVFPLRFRSGFGVKHTAVLVAFTGVFLMCLSSHLLIGLDIGVKNSSRACFAANERYAYFLNNIWTWIDVCFLFFIPFMVFLLGNMAIIIKVRNRRKAIIPAANSLTSRTNAKDSAMSSKTMTILLFALTGNFMLLLTPMSVYLIGLDAWYKNATSNENIANIDLGWAVVNILMYLNNTINFLLYMISGSRFRKTLKRLVLRMNCCGSSEATLHSTTTNGEPQQGLETL